MVEEHLTWDDVDALIDHLLPQLRGGHDALLIITRGGIVPGGLLAEAMDIRTVLTASVQFETGIQQTLAWPVFHQFPSDSLLVGKRVLVVDDVWSTGRTITTVKGRVEAAGGVAELAVLHYKPEQSLFRDMAPDYYAAVTENWIVYPWEQRRGLELVPAGQG
ncbi:MAG TPA: phosphoribosyltransferase [Anaerolineae bacterium]|nr:phosphoribosyltransferase [Anaerolineae bacterium]